MATRRRSISPIVINKGNQNIAIIGGVVLLGVAYFGVINPILKKLHLKDDPAVKAQEQANNNQLLAWKAATLKVQKPTKSDYEWKVIADTIYNDLRYSYFDDNKEDAGYQVCRVQNDADVAMLITSFAKRTEYWFGINSGAAKDLPAFINSNLSNSKIALINANYQSKGIKFRF